MSNKNLVTSKLGTATATDFVSSVREDAYYIFAAKNTSYANPGDSVVPTPLDSVNDIVVDVYNNMVFGKKINNDDVIEMVPRYDWTSGTVYEMYDDQDTSLTSKPFYATVNTGSQYHVYKCLFNGAGANSTVEPTGTDSSAFETPGDGYVWKYICSANSATMAKFATTQYMPVIANTSVTANAVPGAIEVIKVEDGGLGYDNYLIGTFTSATDLRITGSPLLYAVGGTASNLDDFYNGCLILITSGAATGESRVIVDYYISGDKKIVVVDSAFTSTLAVNDTFEIYPYVYVFDTGGTKQSNCIARAIVSNTSGNSISKVEILNPGSGYRQATAVILPAEIVAVDTEATLRPIISPPGGHGSDVLSELGAKYAGVSVKFVQNEEALTTENDFRQFGILKNPYFANVNIKIDINETIGSFAPNELVYKYKDARLAGTVQVFGNTIVTGTNTFLDDALSVDDFVLITDGVNNVFTKVAAVTNSTQISLMTNTIFSNTNCSIARLTTSPFGILVANSAGEIFLSNVNVSNYISSNKLVGESSFSTSIIDTGAILPISINGRNPNNFNTYTQLTKFIGNLNTGLFIEDEAITQDSIITFSQPQGRFHSFVENGATDELYMTNVRNIFQTSASPDSTGEIVGEDSGASFTITDKYNGELVPDSGDVVYIENTSPISRANTQSETIKIILEF